MSRVTSADVDVIERPVLVFFSTRSILHRERATDESIDYNRLKIVLKNMYLIEKLT